MAEIITMEPKKLLNFKDNKIQLLTLDELSSTIKEEDYNGKPIMGMYHFDYISKVKDSIEKAGLQFQMDPIWAAQNQDKSRPGVSVIERAREEFGENDPRSFLLRRIFSKFIIHDLDNEMSNTSVALSYNQMGFQLAFGPNVKICQNLSIMGADKFMSTYAMDKKMPNPERMVEVLGEWLHNFEEIRKRDLKTIQMFEETMIDDEGVLEMIGELTAKRIRRESNRFPQEPMPPLNQGQISKFTLSYLTRKADFPNQIMSAWDLYNFATELYKPEDTDFPIILSSNYAMSQYLTDKYNLN
jgi:hypothetical protein